MSETLNHLALQLDLRTVAPRDRHPLIFGHFDALETGQSMQLVNDHNPQPLRYQFEDRAAGQFEWRTLNAGPLLWRIEITRTARTAARRAVGAGDSCCSGGACCG